MISIKSMQLNTKREEIIKEKRTRGIEVNEYNVSLSLQEFFKEHTLGLPYFKPDKIFKSQISNRDQYNKSMSNIYYDLSNAFKLFNIHSNDAIISSINVSNRISNLTNKLMDLLKGIDTLNKFAETKVSHNQFLLTFNSFENINRITDKEKNIYSSTCEIDFASSTIRNKIYTSGIDKIDLSTSNIKITNNSTTYKVSGNINNILNDVANDIVVLTATSNDNINSTDIVVDFKESVSASRIKLSSSFLYNATVELYLKKNGLYVLKEKADGDSINTFRFNKESFDGFKLVINKTDADALGDKSTFYYSIKNISVFNDKYTSNSTFISNGIKCDKSINHVEIKPIHSIFNKTDISYYVGLENNEGIVSWKEVLPNVPFNLGLYNKYNSIVHSYNNDVFGTKSTNENGTAFNIARLEENANLNSVNVHVGKTQWIIERLGCPIPSNYKCNIKDYKKEYVSHIAPYDANNVDIICNSQDNYFVMTQYVYVDKDTVVDNRMIDFKTTTEKFDCAIFVNGKQSFIKDNKYAFILKKGENVIHVMFILSNHKTTGTIKPIRHNLNLLSFTGELYAERKSVKMEDLKLKNVINPLGLKYYSISNVNDKNYISVMFDPIANADIKISCADYFRTYVEYNYASQNALNDIIVNDKINIRVMAKLMTADESVSPSINNIKVVCV